VIRRLTMGAALLALTVPAQAANKDLERLQIQIANVEAQLAELKRGSDDTLKEVRRLNEALADQNASLKRSLQDQRVQQETLQASLKDLTERLGALGERFQAAQSGGAPPPAGAPQTNPAGGPQGPPPSAAPATSSTAAPRELYSQAYADYARGNYDLAIQGFQEYLRQYPNTDFSDNAEYWIGECLYGKGKYVEAVEAWKKLFTDFPSSAKIPDAHYKRGLALEKLGRRSQALLEYRFVVDRFPNSEAGRRAREKLNPQ
jgi:tol-pal system protein YbgF